VLTLRFGEARRGHNRSLSCFHEGAGAPPLGGTLALQPGSLLEASPSPFPVPVPPPIANEGIRCARGGRIRQRPALVGPGPGRHPVRRPLGDLLPLLPGRLPPVRRTPNPPPSFPEENRRGQEPGTLSPLLSHTTMGGGTGKERRYPQLSISFHRMIFRPLSIQKNSSFNCQRQNARAYKNDNLKVSLGIFLFILFFSPDKKSH